MNKWFSVRCSLTRSLLWATVRTKDYLHFLFYFFSGLISRWRFGATLVAQTVKNLLAMQETRVSSLGQENPLEKGMATHFTILAWKTPWAEEPGGLQSMYKETHTIERVSHFFYFRVLAISFDIYSFVDGLLLPDWFCQRTFSRSGYGNFR